MPDLPRVSTTQRQKTGEQNRGLGICENEHEELSNIKGAHLIRIRLQRFSLHGQKHKQGINATKVS